MAGTGGGGRVNWVAISLCSDSEMAMVSLHLWLPEAAFWWHWCVSPLGNLCSVPLIFMCVCTKTPPGTVCHKANLLNDSEGCEARDMVHLFVTKWGFFPHQFLCETEVERVKPRPEDLKQIDVHTHAPSLFLNSLPTHSADTPHKYWYGRHYLQEKIDHQLKNIL